MPPSERASALTPNFFDGPADIQGDVHLHQRFFSYKTEAGWVAGKTFNVMFTIDRPAREVWPHLKDFNPWQNEYGHFYSGIIGDLEGQSFMLSDKSSDEPGEYPYEVLRVIPEHLIVLSQPLLPENRATGMSPDHHVFMLNEHGGKTIVAVLMEHAALFEEATEEQALAPWRAVAPESQRKWRDIFIPTLKKLIYEGRY